ncbi:MAG TPA: TusE/DsrC/DsvC family sulfur relay protein [Gammaproteobacteria bacterium]|nr:TusE/DsrC/DsvC family sulfur relay protein [Gammaproteobacteria bacterium]
MGTTIHEARTITVNGRKIPTDEEGYLLDPNQWDEDVARALAEREGLTLTDTHWGLINYFREYYEDHQVNPSMRKLVLTLGRHHGEPFHDAKAYEEFLYELFPTSPVAELSKLAGLPKPEELLTGA